VNKGPEVDYKTAQCSIDNLNIDLPWGIDRVQKAMFICIPSGGNIKRHSDNTPTEDERGKWKTFHIPLKTNNECISSTWIDGIKLDYNLKLGEVWELDTWPDHESVNKGLEERIHLVINVYE